MPPHISRHRRTKFIRPQFVHSWVKLYLHSLIRLHDVNTENFTEVARVACVCLTVFTLWTKSAGQKLIFPFHNFNPSRFSWTLLTVMLNILN